jgi:hypothetical protein
MPADIPETRGHPNASGGREGMISSRTLPDEKPYDGSTP